MPSRDLNLLSLELRRRCQCSVRDYARLWRRDPMVIVTCTYRTPEEQGELWEQGRTKTGKIVTWAQPGESPHNCVPAEAFDIGFLKDGVPLWDREHFQRFALIAQAYGIEWGGDWHTPDLPHFQRPGWKPGGGPAHAWPPMLKDWP